jgi:hypothetical protein
VVVSPIQHHLQQTAVSKSVQDQNDKEVLKKVSCPFPVREDECQKKKGMGGPKGILGQKRRPYPQISATPTFCISQVLMTSSTIPPPHINQQKL